MAPYLEFEGKNVEKAIKKACDKLKLPTEELNYKVISYGSTGMFGVVGSKKAKIGVIPPEEKERNAKKREGVSSLLKKISSENNVETKNYGTTDDPAETGKDMLRRIIDLISSDATISVDKSPDRILYRVNGGNSAIIIGKHGQTLEAIQYIVEKCTNKKTEQRVRVYVDVNGYLEKRKANLEGLAVRLAEKSKNNGKPVTVGKMNAYDRRIVHLALKDNTDVRTQSIGNGSIRKLMIFPKKNSGI